MPNRSIRTVLIVLAAVAGAACGRRILPERDPVLLALDGQQVRQSEFDRHIAALEQRGGASLDPEVRKAVLQAYLEERVLVLEARARGLLGASAEPADERSAVQQLLSSTAFTAVDVSEEEIQAYYAAHQDELSVPEHVTLRQVLVATENEAREARRKVEKDPKQFDLLARTVSRGPEAAQGGLMGSFARGELPPELEQAAFALPAGAVSDAVRTPLGYHVLRVDAHEPARPRPLPECREEVRGVLARQKSDRAVHDYVQGLLARAKVNHDVENPASPRRS